MPGYLYGFRLRPVHSSSVPEGVRILERSLHRRYSTHGAAVLDRRLTAAEEFHFDLDFLNDVSWPVEPPIVELKTDGDLIAGASRAELQRAFYDAAIGLLPTGTAPFVRESVPTRPVTDRDRLLGDLGRIAERFKFSAERVGQEGCSARRSAADDETAVRTAIRELKAAWAAADGHGEA